jgi:hypothetical protein
VHFLYAGCQAAEKAFCCLLVSAEVDAYDLNQLCDFFFEGKESEYSFGGVLVNCIFMLKAIEGIGGSHDASQAAGDWKQHQENTF